MAFRYTERAEFESCSGWEGCFRCRKILIIASKFSGLWQILLSSQLSDDLKIMVIEFLYMEDCPNQEPALELLKEMMEDHDVAFPIKLIKIGSVEEAIKFKFMGSPSIRIDGVDLEGDEMNGSENFGLKCRVYKFNWVFQGVPPKNLLREALERAKNEEIS